MTVRSCIKSMRLRTLPLSLAGVITGIALAFSAGTEVPPPGSAAGTAPEAAAAAEALLPGSAAGTPALPLVVALLLTTALLQILSNLSNELGDTLHGTDTAERQGIRYSLQDGDMTIPQMKRLIAVIAGLCCISGLAMVLLSFGELFALEPLCLLALGAAAIWAAMHYTLGDNPYGYRGLGDIFVFIFFGLVSVLGAGYVCSHTIRAVWILPAAAMGCWSIGVLNVNNIRDMKTDAATRTTVALKLGLHNARIYQSVLISGGWILMLAFSLLTASGWLQWLYFITAPLFVLHLRGVWARTGRSLDPMLPLLVMSTFLTALLSASARILH